jgi:hypothetical protein
MRHMGRSARSVAVALIPVVLAACTSGGAKEPDGNPTGQTTLAAQVASPDLWAGAPQDVQVGVTQSTPEGVRLLTFGHVDLRFVFLGDDGGAQPVAGPTATAAYVPAPATPAGGDTADLSAPSDARGVYEAPDVMFDRAGIWQADVIADVPGTGTVTITAAFQVKEEPLLPAPGDPAPRTKNLTIHSKGVPPEAIDSRAATTGTIPDPELHRWTIADAIREGKPTLVLFATPVYCLSQFCGPDADELAKIAPDYGDRAAFIMVEIWKDFPNKVINRAAATWVYDGADVSDPWLFLIGRDGTIVDRWAPLWDPVVVRDALDRALG